MMNVVNCVTGQHDIWLVLLATLVCVSGSWVTVGLFTRSANTGGAQHFGWLILSGVAGGSAIWSTHFIAMLGYEPGVPVGFDPILTIVSLIIAIAGTGLGLGLATGGWSRFSPAIGGGVVGLAISVMHYTGMMAYRVDGLVTWHPTYVAASILLAVVLGSLSLTATLRGRQNLAVSLLVAAIVSLHFTGMTAFQITPLALSGTELDRSAAQGLAISIAVVGLIITAAGCASYLIDDTTRADSYEKLRHMALHDPLTGLPNRASFNEHAQRAIACPRRQGRKIAFIGIDLDKFKELNDLRGHSAGDDLLRTLGQRIEAMLQDGEFLARVGGDEFAAIKDYEERNELFEFLSRLEKTLLAPVEIDGFEAAVEASIGVATYPADGSSHDVLMNNADLAMYRAKNDAMESVCFYEPAMDEAVRQRRALASDLRHVIAKGQLEVNYQPQTVVATGEMCGYEALLRWNHPERGAVPPSDFVPLAEETGMMVELGEWVLRRACADAAQAQHPFKVAVNVSPVQLERPDLPQLVHRVLLETGLKPGLLELEMTESTLVRNPERSLHVLRQIRSLGVSIALDDFGTGNSSLGTLRSFPFNKIKLDRSFVSELEASPQAMAIIRAVLALGNSLDVPVLAEGIETASQLDLLAREGCHEAQGFFLGVPARLEIVTKGEREAS